MSENDPSAPNPPAGERRPVERPVRILSRQSVLWRHLDGPGMQLARISDIPEGHIIDGRVLTVFDDRPAEVHFAVMCHADWTTRYASATVVRGSEPASIQLRRDEQGRWWSTRARHPGASASEEHVAGMDGVHDVDFAISPATNTLPIRRLALAVGEARDTDALWVGFPDFALERLPQRYARESAHTYAYESSSGDFTARLEVDGHGVIVRYGDLWERIATGE